MLLITRRTLCIYESVVQGLVGSKTGGSWGKCRRQGNGDVFSRRCIFKMVWAVGGGSRSRGWNCKMFWYFPPLWQPCVVVLCCCCGLCYGPSPTPPGVTPCHHWRRHGPSAWLQCHYQSSLVVLLFLGVYPFSFFPILHAKIAFKLPILNGTSVWLGLYRKFWLIWVLQHKWYSSASYFLLWGMKFFSSPALLED